MYIYIWCIYIYLIYIHIYIYYTPTIPFGLGVFITHCYRSKFPKWLVTGASSRVLAQHRHRVGLVYASAVPVNAYLNQCAEVIRIEFFRADD